MAKTNHYLKLKVFSFNLNFKSGWAERVCVHACPLSFRPKKRETEILVPLWAHSKQFPNIKVSRVSLYSLSRLPQSHCDYSSLLPFVCVWLFTRLGASQTRHCNSLCCITVHQMLAPDQLSHLWLGAPYWTLLFLTGAIIPSSCNYNKDYINYRWASVWHTCDSRSSSQPPAPLPFWRTDIYFLCEQRNMNEQLV